MYMYAGSISSTERRLTVSSRISESVVQSSSDRSRPSSKCSRII